MKKIKFGLTGGIGSGKSYVAQLFEAMLVPVYYADNAAKNIMMYDLTVKNKLISILGESAYLSDNSLNKTYIADRIFHNNCLLMQINQIVHPAVWADFERWSDDQSASLVIMEAAVIFESHLNDKLDGVILVLAPEEIRIQRVCARDLVNVQNVLDRMRNQMPDEEKVKLSNYVINNDETVLLVPQIVEIIHKVTSQKN